MRRRCSWLEFDVVARRVNRSPSSLGRLLSNPRVVSAGEKVPLGTGGELRLDAPFELDVRGPSDGWRTRGRLIGRGPRLVPYSRVDVLIAPWSEHSCELRVEPRSRHLHRWGAQRLRRYYRLAHAAADHLVSVLTSGPTQTPHLPNDGSARWWACELG